MDHLRTTQIMTILSGEFVKNNPHLFNGLDNGQKLGVLDIVSDVLLEAEGSDSTLASDRDAEDECFAEGVLSGVVAAFNHIYEEGSNV